MIIDMHSHYYPESLIRYLLQRETIPFLREHQNGLQFTTHSGTIDFNKYYSNIDSRFKFMQKLGIEKQLITFPGSLGFDASFSEGSTKAITDTNSEILDIIKSYPKFFKALFGLPIYDQNKSINEYKRLTTLGCRGVIMPCTFFLQSDWIYKSKKLLSLINDSFGHILVHPNPPVVTQEYNKMVFNHEYKWLDESVFNLLDQVTRTLVRIILDDIASLYSNITWQFISLGGFYAFSFNRINSIIKDRNILNFDLELPSSFYFDTSSMGRSNIEFAINHINPSRIIVGTDYPIFSNDHLLEDFHEINISNENKEKILYANSKIIFANL
jgi:Predicted metal-dependent hydrolase of the TIM-barrel fold